MELDINLAEQTTADNLPDQTQNKMFSNLDDISTTNVDNRATNTLGRLNNNVVVFCHLEGVKVLGLSSGKVEYTLIDGIGDTVVDELGKHQTVLALVEHLEGVGRKRKAGTNVGITGKDGVDVAGEFGAFILVNCVGDVGVRTLDMDLAAAADASLGDMTACPLRNDAGRSRGSSGCGLCAGRSFTELGNELYT